jgi:hypothetical protein
MPACRELLEEVSHGFFTVNYPQFVRCYEVHVWVVQRLYAIILTCCVQNTLCDV